MQCFFEKKKTRNAMADNHPKIRFLKWSQSLIKLKVSFETIYWWTVEYYRCNGKHTVKNLHCQGPRRNPQSSNLICNLTCNLLDILSLKALNISEIKLYGNYLTSDSHTNTIIILRLISLILNRLFTHI